MIVDQQIAYLLFSTRCPEKYPEFALWVISIVNDKKCYPFLAFRSNFYLRRVTIVFILISRFRIRIGLIPAILLVGYSPPTGNTGKYRYP